ncbi:MAG TPA: hypothetical protein VJ870_18095 [Amycolatopsis sp.]|nr:hypothetical protein [Amycolatopsis sp.]
MSLFGFIEGAAEAVGGPIVTAAIEGGKALGRMLGGSQAIAGQATMSPEALVKMITQGAGPDGLVGEQQKNTSKAQVQDQIETATRQHMTTIESAWTGSGADAARDKLQAATVPVSASSQAMNANANTISGQIGAFGTLKNSLHTDVTDNPPQKGFWDDVTPWDTSTEDAINANNAKVQQNLQAYNAYTQASQANTPQIKTDYGQVTDLGGGDFQIQQPGTPPDKPGQGPNDPGTNIGGTGGGKRVGSTSVPSQPGRASIGNTPIDADRTGIGLPPGSSTGKDGGNISGSLDDTTRTSGYTTPGSSNYVPTGFGSGYNPAGSGGSSDYSSGGFGPVGSGFGPVGSGGVGSGGGSAGGYGGGGASSGASTGSGALTGGKATGAVGAEAGAAGAAAKAGAAGASGTAGRGGMSGMGGGHGGKGGEDEEHQRPSYLIEEDPDSLFGTDEKTAPPVIGL